MGPDGAVGVAAPPQTIDPSAYSSMIAALDDETATSILCQILGNKPNIVPGVVGFSAQLQEAVAMGAAQTAADFRQAADAMGGIAVQAAQAEQFAHAEQAVQAAQAPDVKFGEIQTTAKSGSPAVPNGYASGKGSSPAPVASSISDGKGGGMTGFIDGMHAGPEALSAHSAPAVGLGRHIGIIKAFNIEKGYGFIFSADVKAQYGCDVFLHHQHMVGFHMGSEVSFTVKLNKNGKPQAIDLADATGVLAAQETAHGQALADESQWLGSQLPGQAPPDHAQLLLGQGLEASAKSSMEAEQSGWDATALSRAIAEGGDNSTGSVIPEELLGVAPPESMIGVAPPESMTAEGIVGVAPLDALCGEKRPSTVPSIPAAAQPAKKPRA